jgi:3',5'-cyclic AMP phosphodiesterase CpdA
MSCLHAFGQAETIVRETNINDDIPDATYKFSYVHLTDIHVGEGQGDYGTPGYLDDKMPVGDVGYSAERLRKAVNWINANAAEKGIKFVIVSGDITDSGERSEFEKAKEILDALDVPYVPTIGNHDIWPYVSYGNEAPYAYGDSVMNDVFKDVYDSLKNFFDFWDDGTRLTRVFNPESGYEHYHQNFMFEYKGFRFMMFDHNPRYHVTKAEPGIGAEARLNDFSGGTFEWLLKTLEAYPNKGAKNIFFVTHQPPHRDPISLINGLPWEQYDKMSKALVPYKNHMAAWLAGHVHRNRDYAVSTIVGNQMVMRALETTANKEFDNGQFRIINVYEAPDVTSIKFTILQDDIRIMPNPATGRVRVQLPPPQNGSYSLKLTDMNGRAVVVPVMLMPGATYFDWNLISLPAGNYIVQVFDGNRKGSKMIQIQR